VNAGVKISGVGAMTGLVVASLVVGKYLGIVAAFLVAKQAGFYPPLGVRLKHVRAGTMRLFVRLCQVAFSEDSSR